MACAGAAAAAAHSRPGMHVENAPMLWVYIQVMNLQGISHIHLAMWWYYIYFIYYIFSCP